MRKLIKEPLVHFLAFGALLFGVGLLRAEAGPDEEGIIITSGVVEHLMEGFRLTWQRPPTGAELQGLVEEYLKEEVLYREAMAMGLDRDDQIVRRRLRQKLEFLTADLVGSMEPTEEDLQAYLDTHLDIYRQEARVGFVQVYIGEREGAEADRARALAILEELRTNPNADPEQMGDPFMYPVTWRDMPERGLLGVFGDEFTAQLVELPAGEWSGPVTSAFGSHIVRLDALELGRPSELHEVRDAVYRDLVSERTSEAEQLFFDNLRSRYRVTMESPEGLEPFQSVNVGQ